MDRTPLAGARVWLSGAIPELDNSSAAQAAAMLEFVRYLARYVFQRGGHIVHGSHPSLTPALLEEAQSYIAQGGKRDALILVVSRHWSRQLDPSLLNQWRRHSLVYETPETQGDNPRDGSLDTLRKWITARADAVVLVGGKWWQQVAGRSGVPIELEMAIERGLPCFLLGGFGGAARDFLDRNPTVLRKLRNGLDDPTNKALSIAEDLSTLADVVCAQLERLPLVRGRGTDGASFRILALDGGGLKGAFTAAALAAWEHHTRLRVVEHFDIIAGTSTGGILAIGLGLGLSGREMLDFYRTRGPVIFPVTRLRGRVRHVVRHLLRPKFSQRTLLNELEKAFRKEHETPRLRASHCRLVIPSYHAVGGMSHVFRTPHHQDLTADADLLATQVALATASAPTYFMAAKVASVISESSFFDGGVWANSPAMAAIIEAVCFLKIPLERIDVLSVGTTDEPFSVRKHTRAGVLEWLWKIKILDLLMNVQQESSLKLARQLVSDARFLRVNVTTSPGSYRLDSPSEIEELADLGSRRALENDVLAQVKSRFLNGVLAAPWHNYSPPDAGH